ncbi:MAG: helix-turn-helix domain-containing protein [Anaerolineales bacterium]|nr:helix-turn-helix domain-containing protein [Anaerolineales bacterium]
MPDSGESLAAYFRRLREDAGFETADAVMRKTNNAISAHAIRAIERGNVDRPKVETLEILAEVYRASLAEMLRRCGYLPAENVGPAGLAQLPPDVREVAVWLLRLSPGKRQELLPLIEGIVRIVRGTEGTENTEGEEGPEEGEQPGDGTEDVNA